MPDRMGIILKHMYSIMETKVMNDYYYYYYYHHYNNNYYYY